MSYDDAGTLDVSFFILFYSLECITDIRKLLCEVAPFPLSLFLPRLRATRRASQTFE